MNRTNVSSSGSRILRVLKALRGHVLNGISNDELTVTLHELPANISRAPDTLVEERLALKPENGRFAPGIQLLRIVTAHNDEMAHTRDRINEINRRVVPGSRL